MKRKNFWLFSYVILYSFTIKKSPLRCKLYCPNEHVKADYNNYEKRLLRTREEYAKFFDQKVTNQNHFVRNNELRDIVPLKYNNIESIKLKSNNLKDNLFYLQQLALEAESYDTIQSRSDALSTILVFYVHENEVYGWFSLNTPDIVTGQVEVFCETTQHYTNYDNKQCILDNISAGEKEQFKYKLVSIFSDYINSQQYRKAENLRSVNTRLLRKFPHLFFTMKLRLDGVCISAKSEYNHTSDRLSNVVFGSFRVWLQNMSPRRYRLPRNGVELTSIPWTVIMTLESGFFDKGETWVDYQVTHVIRSWIFEATKAETSTNKLRNRIFGASHIQEIIDAEIFTNHKYLTFGCNIHQLINSIPTNEKTYFTVFPIEPERLFPAERIMIQCVGYYPVKTFVGISIKIPDSNSGGVEYRIYQCEQNLHWVLKTASIHFLIKLLRFYDAMSAPQFTPVNQDFWRVT